MKEITIGDLITAGIDIRDCQRNMPTEPHMKNLSSLIDNVLNPLINQFPTAEIMFGYISPSISSRYYGTLMGSHKQGRAAAIWWCGDNLDIEQSIHVMYKWIVDNLQFNMLDIYDTYIDISYDERYNYRIVNNLSIIHNEDIASGVVQD